MRRTSWQSQALSSGAGSYSPARTAIVLWLVMLLLVAGPVPAQTIPISSPVLTAQANVGSENGKNSAQQGDRSRKPKASQPVKRSSSTARNASPRPPASAQGASSKPAAAAAAAGAAGAVDDA